MRKETKINSAEYQAPEIQVINVEMEGVIAASGNVDNAGEEEYPIIF